MSRQALVEVTLSGVNITDDISGDTVTVTYTDNSGEEVDDLSISIQNRTGKWLHSWFPQEGDRLQARIVTREWGGRLDLGSFTVDKVSLSGWPQVVSIGGIAMPSETDFSGVLRSGTWNQATLRQIVESVAGRNSIPVEYESAYNPTLGFVSQTEQSDKAFLHDLCAKHGLTLKLFSTRIIVYDMSAYEKKAAANTLKAEEMLSYSCEGTITNTGYTACTVRYTDKSGQALDYTYRVQGKTSKVYRHTTQVSSLSEAQQVAKAKLRELNMGETTFSCSVPGNTRLVAGMNVEIAGFGNFDGKYMIDKATHTIGGGYTTSLDMHRVMMDEEA